MSNANVVSKGRARELLKDRFRVMIRKLDTDATVRGGSAKSRRMHVAEGLHGARARGSRECYSFESFYCESLGSCFLWDDSQTRFYSEMSQTRKKEEALRRVLLFRWTVAGSLQSTCPDVCRRGHHWLYRRLHRHCRPQ